MNKSDMPPEVWAEVLERLIARREMLGMSQSEVARRSGIPQSNLCGLEAGRLKSTSFRNVVAWAAALRMTIKIGLLLDCAEYAEPYFGDLTPKAAATRNVPDPQASGRLL